MKKETIIGIDLGTANSCAAVVEDSGQVKLIPHKGGEYIIPSVFAIDDKGNELVGHEAKRQWQLNPKNTVYGAKRLVGRSFRSEIVETMKQVAGYSVRPGPHNDVVIDVGRREFSMQEVSARILRKIVEVASEYLRRPVKLVYDLGGGTFDVSVIEIRDRVFEVKATGGDIFLGGIDFDNVLMRHVLEAFKAKTQIDLATDPVAMQRVRDLSERAKCDLSSREEVPFNIPFITMTQQGQPLNLEMSFTRQKLEELTSALIDRTLTIVAGVLVDCGVDTKDVGEVLLVGGQTRMPAVQQLLTRFFGKLPSRGVNPDEAVAIGAALYAHSLEDDTNLRLQLLDVIPMAIGLERAGGSFHVVFPRNAPIPNAKQVTATTSYDLQTELAMRIFQGDNDQVARNELLGDFSFSGIRPERAGRVEVEITFDVNVEGILTMHARDPATGKEMKTTVRVT